MYLVVLSGFRRARTCRRLSSCLWRTIQFRWTFSLTGLFLLVATVSIGIAVAVHVFRSVYDAFDIQLVPAWAIAQDGSRFALASYDWKLWESQPREGALLLYDTETGPSCTFRWPLSSRPSCLAFDRSGHILAAGCSDGKIAVLNALTCQRQAEVKVNGHVTAVAVSPGKDVLAAAIRGTSATTLFNAADGSLIAELPGKSDFTCLVFCQQGTVVAGGSSTGTVHIWHVQRQAAVTAIQAGSTPITALALSPDGREIAVGSDDGSLGIWIVETGARRRIFPGQTTKIGGVAFSHDGTRLAVATGDTTRLWDLVEDTHSPVFAHGTVWAIALAARGAGLIRVTPESIEHWDTDGRRIRSLPLARSRDVPQPWGIIAGVFVLWAVALAAAWRNIVRRRRAAMNPTG